MYHSRMLELILGAVIAGIVGLASSLVMHGLSTRARRKELAESRMQDRREAVYFETMDYLAGRIGAIHRFAMEPWSLKIPDENPGTLGRLELVAGGDVLREARSLLNAIDAVGMTLAIPSLQIVSLKNRVTALEELIKSRRILKTEWLEIARNFAVSGDHDRSSVAGDKARSAQELVDELTKNLQTLHFEVLEAHYELLASYVEVLPATSEAQAQLSIAIRKELSIPTERIQFRNSARQSADIALNAHLAQIKKYQDFIHSMRTSANLH